MAGVPECGGEDEFAALGCGIGKGTVVRAEAAGALPRGKSFDTAADSRRKPAGNSRVRRSLPCRPTGDAGRPACKGGCAMFGFGKKKAAVDESALAAQKEEERLRDILRNFSMNRISATTAASMSGLGSVAALKTAMAERGISFPRSLDADPEPMADLVLRMLHDAEARKEPTEPEKH